MVVVVFVVVVVIVTIIHSPSYMASLAVCGEKRAILFSRHLTTILSFHDFCERRFNGRKIGG